ncbi:MAG: ABC transporter permease [Clostridia bacterium]|nr:ABC transporter permease [Clostridia bacterium]
MKRTVFAKMAFVGIERNRRLYLPYIFSCIGTVAMAYIVQYISVSPAISQLKGGNTLAAALSMCKLVILVFSLIFLFYTNSFLSRRRNREYGLYSILGVDKKGLIRIAAWESLTVSAISIIGGTVLGAALSKLAELGLIRLIHTQADYSVPVSAGCIGYTALEFAVIFALLYIASVIRICRCNTLELMKSEQTGEKPPKASALLAVAGAVILAGAYFIAVSVKNPISTLFMFFIAVLMVIAATYLLFISGSVFLCRILVKNKSYYYKKNHFVSVSSMAYRMKRNGAGLAGICILSTMVLVMIGSSSSLFFGAEESIKSRYPYDNEINVYIPALEQIEDNKTDEIKQVYEKIIRENAAEAKNVSEFTYCKISGLDSADGKIQLDPGESFSVLSYDRLRTFYFLTQDEYNRCTGERISLSAGEAAVSTLHCKFNAPVLEIGEMKLKIKEKCGEFTALGEANSNVVPSVVVVVPDYDTVKPLEKLTYGENERMLEIQWHYAYDLDESDELTAAIYEQQLDCLEKIDFINSDGISYNSGCRTKERADFYITFGGLFFIGIILSVLFILAQVLIIYYKQITEGYEDRARFAILQKVGMTKDDIKKSINSQVLTVFFAPLIMAGIHFAFAFSPIWKILQLFNLNDLKLVVLVSLAAFAVFGLCYTGIYRLTAKAYYKIVSE